MADKKIVVFDVDHTLIKGNLTFFFMRKICWHYPMLIGKMTILLFRGLMLTWIQLPRIVKYALKSQPNFESLDQNIRQAIGAFHLHIAALFAHMHLHKKTLNRYARHILSDRFLVKIMFNDTFAYLKKELQNPDTIVILASGGVNDLVLRFYTFLCGRLDQENINWKNRFFAIGTKLHTNQQIIPCVGSNKIILIEKTLKQKKIPLSRQNIDFVYSDNKHMADLPIFSQAQHGGMLLQKWTPQYRTLPKNLLNSLLFQPIWR